MTEQVGHTIEVLARGVVEWGEHVLLCRSVKGGYCYLPGGHVEFGETAGAALTREFVEETGIDVAVGQFVAVHEQVFHQKGVLRHEVSVVFHVELPKSLTAGTLPGSGTPPPVASLEPKIEFVWVRRQDLDEVEMLPEAHRVWVASTGRRPVWIGEA